MLGLNYIRAAPTTYLMAFKGGKAVRQGAGLSLLYYAPTTNLVAVPIGSREAAFIFEKVTADFQTVRVQGQVSYRIAEPAKAAVYQDSLPGSPLNGPTSSGVTQPP